MVSGGGVASAVAGGSFTYVQSAAGYDTKSVVLNGVAAGNLIVAYCGTDGALPSAVSDGTSSFTLGTGNTNSRFAYLLSANSGNKTYTFTSTGSDYQMIVVAEFSYTGSISVDVQGVAGPIEGTASSSGNVTTTGSTELVVGGSYIADWPLKTLSSMAINGAAADGSRTGGTGETTAYMWWKVFDTTFTGASTATISSNTIWRASIISFKVE